MKIPTPQELGLPPKFASWRPVQEQMLHDLMTETKRGTGSAAPVGSGKTPVGIGWALWTKKSTCFVTESKGLQNQMMEDFGEIGLVSLMGRSNYPCHYKKDYTCEQGYVAKCPHKGTMACPSTNAETRASISPLVVTNYAKWTSARKFGNGMSHFQQVVFDESHHAPDALSDAMQLELGAREMEEELEIDFPDQPEEMVNWRAWAIDARPRVQDAYRRAKEIVERGNARFQAVHELNHFRNLARRMAILATARPENWIVEQTKYGFQFDPIVPARYAETALLLRLPRIVFMSGTLRPKTLYMLGLPTADFTFHDYPSDFDPARVPFYYKPTMRVDARAGDLSLLWMCLDQFAAPRRDRKGMVNSISFARRDEILAFSRFANKMIVNPRGLPAQETLEKFRDAGPGSILVSPSFGTGYDFMGALCEWQFISKIPFDPPSRILKAREELDREYRAYRAMNKLWQFYGRIGRSREDAGETVIADSHMDWFWPKFKHLAPKYAHKMFKQVAVLPPPPPKL